MSHDTRVQIEDSTNSDGGFSRNLDEFKRKERKRRAKKRKWERIFREAFVCVCVCICIYETKREH